MKTSDAADPFYQWPGPTPRHTRMLATLLALLAGLTWASLCVNDESQHCAQRAPLDWESYWAARIEFVMEDFPLRRIRYDPVRDAIRGATMLQRARQRILPLAAAGAITRRRGRLKKLRSLCVVRGL